MSEEETKAPPPDDGSPQSSSDGYDHQPPTGSLPAYEPAPPGAYYPNPPQWSAPAPAVVRFRLRDHLLIGLSVVLSFGLVFGLGYMWVGDSVVAVQRVGNDAQSNGDGGANQAAQPQPDAQGFNLNEGAVFMQTNDAKANAVVAFARSAEGKLREIGRFPTGGAGSGSVEDVAQSLVLGTADGEASPIHNLDKAELLFVPNAGSNTISVFRVKADGLELASEVPSGGQKPVSLTVNNGLLYVSNSGEFDNRLFVGETVLENCGHGQLPSVTGFRVTPDGNLTQIEGSTRLLSGEHESGCAQISFSPDGKTLLATERIAGKKDEATGFGKGAITTFPVHPDGTLGPPNATVPTGNGPYAFTFTKDGTVLLMAEQNGGSTNVGGGHVTSYALANGVLTPIGGSVPTTGTDTCWIVLTNDQKYAFTTSPFVGGRISTLGVGNDGAMTLLHPVATAPDGKDEAKKGTTDLLLDLALSRDSKYIYTIEGFYGDLYAFKVNNDGTLTLIEKHHVVNLPPLELGWQGGPYGIAAF